MAYYLSFDGTDDYASLTNNAIYDITDEITIEASLKLPSIVSSWHQLIFKSTGSGSTTRAYGLGLNGSQLYVHFSNGSSIATGITLTAGTWYKIRAELKSAVSLKVWIDDVLHYDNTTTFSLLAKSGSTLTLGRLGAFSGEYGKVDFKYLKLERLGSVLGYYDFTSANTGAIANDTGTNNLDGTITGATWVDDGTGGGTNATVNAITASTAASSLVPTVTAQKQVSVSSAVANATADAGTPSISLAASTTITGVTANATTAALNPQVGVFTNATISAIIANAIAGTNVPNVGATRNLNIAHIVPNMVATAIIPTIRIVEPVIFRVGVPVVSNLEKELSLRSELENTMPVSTNIISTISIKHSV